MTERVKKLIEKHRGELEDNIIVPMFLEALIVGGTGFVDELRAVMEDAGIDLSEMDFTRLKE